MILTVHLDGTITSSFVHLHPSIANPLLPPSETDAIPVIPLLVTPLKSPENTSEEDAKAPPHVLAWTGGGSKIPNALVLSPFNAAALGLVEGQSVSVATAPTPSDVATSVSFAPTSTEDWEAITKQASMLETSLLASVSLVAVGQPLALPLLGASYTVTLTPVAIELPRDSTEQSSVANGTHSSQNGDSDAASAVRGASIDSDKTQPDEEADTEHADSPGTWARLGPKTDLIIAPPVEGKAQAKQEQEKPDANHDPSSSSSSSSLEQTNGESSIANREPTPEPELPPPPPPPPLVPSIVRYIALGPYDAPSATPKGLTVHFPVLPRDLSQAMIHARESNPHSPFVVRISVLGGSGPHKDGPPVFALVPQSPDTELKRCGALEAVLNGDLGSDELPSGGVGVVADGEIVLSVAVWNALGRPTHGSRMRVVAGVEIDPADFMPQPEKKKIKKPNNNNNNNKDLSEQQQERVIEDQVGSAVEGQVEEEEDDEEEEEEVIKYGEIVATITRSTSAPAEGSEEAAAAAAAHSKPKSVPVNQPAIANLLSLPRRVSAKKKVTKTQSRNRAALTDKPGSSPSTSPTTASQLVFSGYNAVDGPTSPEALDPNHLLFKTLDGLNEIPFPYNAGGPSAAYWTLFPDPHTVIRLSYRPPPTPTPSTSSQGQSTTSSLMGQYGHSAVNGGYPALPQSLSGLPGGLNGLSPAQQQALVRGSAGAGAGTGEGASDQPSVPAKKPTRHPCAYIMVPLTHLKPPTIIPSSVAPASAALRNFRLELPPPVAGHEKVLANVLKAVLPSVGSSIGPPSRPGVLVTGGRGSGKSRLTDAISAVFRTAPSARATSQVIRLAEWVGEAPEVIGSRLADLTRAFAASAPSVMVLDDLDVLLETKNGGGGSSNGTVDASGAPVGGVVDPEEERRRARLLDVVSQALWPPVFAGSNPHHGVAIVATATSLDTLPKEFLAPGRLTSVFDIPRPNAAGRAALLAAVLKERELGLSDVPSGDAAMINTLLRRKIAPHMDGAVAADAVAVIARAAASKAVNSGGSLSIDDISDYGVAGYRPLSTAGVSLSHRRSENVGSASRGDDDDTSEDQLLGTSGAPGKPDSWAGIGGLASVRSALEAAIAWPVRYGRLWSNLPLRAASGLLLFGAPGTGKTLAAAAAGKRFGLNFISVRGPELLNKYVGASEAGVRSVFAAAAAAAPAVLFFDEFDALAPRRGRDLTGVTDRVVNSFLTALDGLEALQGVVVLAATSRPDLIDPALLRPGRLDTAHRLRLPDQAERREILDAIVNTTKPAPIVNDELSEALDKVAAMSSGWNGADLRGVMDTAGVTAVQRALEAGSGAKAPIVTPEDILNAAAEAKPSLPPSEARRLEKIYDAFERSRSGGGGDGGKKKKKGKKAKDSDSTEGRRTEPDLVRTTHRPGSLGLGTILPPTADGEGSDSDSDESDIDAETELERVQRGHMKLSMA